MKFVDSGVYHPFLFKCSDRFTGKKTIRKIIKGVIVHNEMESEREREST